MTSSKVLTICFAPRGIHRQNVRTGNRREGRQGPPSFQRPGTSQAATGSFATARLTARPLSKFILQVLWAFSTLLHCKWLFNCLLIKIVKKQLLTLYDWMAEDSHYSKYSFAICSSLSPIAPLVCPLKLCVTFVFFLGVTALPREMKDSAYAKFWGANKVYYGEYNICKPLPPCCVLQSQKSSMDIFQL